MNSTNIYSLLLAFISISLLLSSCEDKIDVQLDDADPIIVMDAFLTDTPGEVQEITITKSQPYFDSSAPIPVDNADVEILVSDATGQGVITFDYVDGRYIWVPENNLSLADMGSNFTLMVTIGQVSYFAYAELNESPEIDEIRQETKEDELGYIDGGIYCEVIARDIVGPGNTYWIKSYKNGTFLNRPEEINLAFDAGFSQGADSDGLIFITPVRELINPVPDSTEVADEISPWATGDLCKVEIHSISNSTFSFLELVRDQLLNGRNGIFAEPLANAPSNISASDESTVLGVFNVAQVTSMEIVIE